MNLFSVNGLALSSILSLPSLASPAPFPRSSGIQWSQCETALTETAIESGYNGTINCANLTVPLDYTNTSSNATIELNLLHVPIPSGRTKLGTVQLNYGGPGIVGRAELAATISTFQAITGFAYDLLAFDPRGTGVTLPLTCYNATERTVQAMYPFNVNASDTALGESWVSSGNTASACAARLNYLPYVGTAATARDFMSVVDALGEDGMLHYYGGSYGTILGATIAAMFPDRIGHMLLDGVLDADEYYHDSAEANYILRSDATFTGFFHACALNPSTCALARPNTTGADLESEFYAWLYDLKYRPLGDGVISVIRYSDIKAYIRNMLYAPASWPTFALAIKSLYDGNVTAAYLALGGVSNPGAGIQSTPEANFGIRGADKTVRRHKLAEMAPFINKILETSQSIGDISALVTMVVAQWEVEAVEVYGGDFRVETKTPVLLTSNTWDPVAPLEAAEKLNGLLGGSALLVNDGYGHTVLSQASVCTVQRIQRYYLEGKMPEPNTVCQPDIPLFSTNVTLADVLVLASADL